MPPERGNLNPRRKFLNRETKSLSFTLFLIAIVSFSLAIFLFDLHLILYKRISQSGIIVYANRQSLVSLFKYFLYSLTSLFLIVPLLGFVLKKTKTHNYWHCLQKQAMTFIPLLPLAFGRFFYGKAVRYVFFIPLFPTILLLVILTVVHLNLILHANLNVLRKGWHFLRRNEFSQKKLMTRVALIFLVTLFINQLVHQSYFQRFFGQRLFMGDEPKYLRMTYSLATDGDLDVSDDFIGERAEIERAKDEILKSGSRKFGPLAIIGKDKGIYNFHMPGLSFLILPGFLLDLSLYPSLYEPADLDYYLEARFLPRKLSFTCLCLFLMALGIFFLMARFISRFFRSPFLSMLLLLLFIFNSPLPDFMFQLYPDAAALFFVLLVLNAVLFPFERKWLNYLFIVLGIGYLPWLHYRFILLALGLFFAFVTNEIFFQKNLKRFLIVALLLSLTSSLYFYYFYSITGNPLPTGLQRLYGESFVRLAVFPLGFFGHIFDHSAGMIWFFPWTILAFIGIYRGLQLDRKRSLIFLIASIPYYLLTCMAIPWHGMVKEPARFLVAVFPVLFVFLGYTLKSFWQHPASVHFFLYFVFLAVAFLNRQIHFLVFRFGSSYVSPSDLSQIVQCSLIIAGLYLSIFLSDRAAKSKSFLIDFNKISSSLKNIFLRIKDFLLTKRFVYSILCFWFLIQTSYSLAFIKIWNDRAMALSVFGSLEKLNPGRDFQLFEMGGSSDIYQKREVRVIELFKNEYNFEIAPKKREKTLRLGSALFLEKVPRGCYRVDLEIEGLSTEAEAVSLEFMGENRSLRLQGARPKASASSIFILFKDRFISPLLKLGLESPSYEKISGRLKFYPLSCVIYENDLILRSLQGQYPAFIQKKKGGLYSLTFFINMEEVRKRYKFELYAVRGVNPLKIKQEALLATWFEQFTGKERHVISLDFSLPPDFYQQKEKLALFVYDEQNRPLGCKSLWMKTGRSYWILPSHSD